MTTETFIDQTIDWLNRRVAPEGVTVDADTRLFDAGIVTSLGVLRLIAWTEQAIGREIQDREIRMDRFGSVRSIAEHFLAADSLALAGRSCAAGRGGAAGGFAGAAEGFAVPAPGSASAACSMCGRCTRRAA